MFSGFFTIFSKVMEFTIEVSVNRIKELGYTGEAIPDLHFETTSSPFI